MDESKALAIVSALANGINPLTGEAFPADAPYQAPDVIRALYQAVRMLETGAQRRTRTRSTLHANAGTPWTEEEDQKLLSRFDGGCSITELAKAHGRTQGGIRVRLERHGRISPAEPLYGRRSRTAGAISAAPTAPAGA
jgi:hypothetical protein